jgi:ABC-type sugar transport system substrate-binding protein
VRERVGDLTSRRTSSLILRAAATVEPLEGLGRTREVPFGTFDLSPRVLESLTEGGMLFALDQQQYLQGYLPIVLLTKCLETGTIPGGGQTIATGPRFITAESPRASWSSPRKESAEGMKTPGPTAPGRRPDHPARPVRE